MNQGLLRAGSAVASAALLTAVVSFVKEVSVARLFGAGVTYDAYLVAFAAVTLLPTAIAFVLQSTFIPSFLESRQRNPSEAWAFAGTVISFLTVVLLAGMLILVLSEDAWFSVVIPGFGGPARREVSRVVLLLLPLVWLVGLNELLKSLLNALRSFALPAASQVLPSLFALVGILIWGRSLGIVALAVGWVFGMVVQTSVLLWRCRLLHVRLPLGFRSAPRDLSNLVGLSAPYLAVALMPWALLLIDQHFASQIGAGSISVLNYADRIFRVPLTVLIAALYTSVHPFFAEAAAQRRYDDFGALFRNMIRAGVFVLLPIGLAILVLRHPIVAFVYQRGAFDAQATKATASVLAYLAFLVPALGLWYVCDRALTCLHRTKQLMVLAAFATALKFGASLVLVGRLGLPGLPLATLITFGASVGVMMGFLRSDLGDRVRVSTWVMSRIALAALVSSAGLWATWSGLSAMHLGPVAIQMSIAVLVGIGLYLLASRALKLEESAAVRSAILTVVAVPLRMGRRAGRLPAS